MATNKEIDALAAVIGQKLLTSPAWVERAILALYACQTADEQAQGATRYDNKMGFSGCDARRMSFVAEFLKSGKHLSVAKALNIYGVKLQKYTRQLARIALARKASQEQAVQAA